MRDAFKREALPDAQHYFEGRGLALRGRGTWRTTRCDFHGGSDSMRVNLRSGGWCCMACGVKGGDVLAFHMQVTGMDFVQAARDLGSWSGDDAPIKSRTPAGLSARDALDLVTFELRIVMVLISDARRGELPAEADWQRFLKAVARVEMLAQGASS